MILKKLHFHLFYLFYTNNETFQGKLISIFDNQKIAVISILYSYRLLRIKRMFFFKIRWTI